PAGGDALRGEQRMPIDAVREHERELAGDLPLFLEEDVEVMLLVGGPVGPAGEISPLHALEAVTGADVQVVRAGRRELEPGLRGEIDLVAANAALQGEDAVRPVLGPGGQAQGVPEGLHARLAAAHFEPDESALPGAPEG